MSEFETVFDIEQHVLVVYHNMNVFNLDHGMKEDPPQHFPRLGDVEQGRDLSAL